jgi:FkbM family methyltransferase
MKQFIYRIIYDPVVNRFLRTVAKPLSPVLPRRLRIAPTGIFSLHADGKELKLMTNQTNFLTFLVFWEGYLNWEYTGIFIALIKKMNCFFDVGASIGYYSLLAAMENPNMKIISFEPATGPQFFFKSNIQLNHFSNINLEPVALSHQNGVIDFYEVKNKKFTYLKYNLGGGGNAGSETSMDTFIKTTVPTITLDDYVMTNNIESIDLIKMDTEGTEHLILAHSKYVLEKMKPIIICETLFQTIEGPLEDVLTPYGYEFYNHTESGLEKVSTIRRAEDNGVRNCFFVHPSKYHLVAEFVKPT